MHDTIYLGTSGWSYKDWQGIVYPEGTKAKDYLSEYSKSFPIVEIDSTWYGTPRKTTIEKWHNDTPEDFLFAAKFPKLITHEKELQDCESDVSHFLDTMSGLEDKLGPLLLQFPYAFKADKMDLLSAFLETLPEGFRYAVEVRHKGWLGVQLYELLEKHNIALALIDHPWMPIVEQSTANFSYIRWLGDRKKIPSDFSHEKIDRTESLVAWADFIKRIQERMVAVYGFFNNHYEGHSPGSLAKFEALLDAE
jgi:uncharacterized protein YecE (DUF72 family)